MMVSTGINYRQTYFEYPELTKIHGEPNSESLFKLRNHELKANAQSVYSNLSDGVHGHLALVLTDAQYLLVLTDVPFDIPVHPGILQIPDGTTAAMIAALKEAHHEQLRLFREVQGIEKALIQQIVTAVEAPYLAAIRDRASNSLRGPIRSILLHLKTLYYGRVSQQMLADREQELRNMLYNAKYPIDMVFNAVEDFVDYADMGDQPMTQKQTIAKAYTILNKTRCFKTAITEWNRHPELQKTWITFKDHFRQAHMEFRETTDVTLEDSELERNNVNMVQQVVDSLQSALALGEQQEADAAALREQMANFATRQSESHEQLANQLTQMQHAMALLQSQVNKQGQQGQQRQYPSYQGYQGGRGYQGGQGYHGQDYQGQGYQRQGYQGQGYQGGRGYQGPGYQGGQQYNQYNSQQGGRSQGRHYSGCGRGRNGGRFGGQGRDNHFRQRNVSMYCWTHGGCGHTSADCQTKLQGHQNAATFANKMSGNTQNCPP
jgi:hypothetical protein